MGFYFLILKIVRVMSVKKLKKTFVELKNKQSVEIISETAQNQVKGGSGAGVIVEMMP